MLKLAIDLKSNPNLVFYIINLSLNEPKTLQVEETPVLYLYKPKTSTPIKFRGPMKTRTILSFLAKHMGNKLNEVLIEDWSSKHNSTQKSCESQPSGLTSSILDQPNIDL